MYRPLRADECLPVLTHRHVPESTSDKDVTGDKQVSMSRRHRKDSHHKSDSKVVLCSMQTVPASVNYTDVTADSRKQWPSGTHDSVVTHDSAVTQMSIETVIQLEQ